MFDLKKAILLFTVSFILLTAAGQGKDPGIITATVMDENKKAMEGVTVSLMPTKDSMNKKSLLTDKNGSFTFVGIPFGYYRLRLSYVGMQSLVVDSIYFRPERFDFNLNDLVMKASKSQQLDEVVVYVEK